MGKLENICIIDDDPIFIYGTKRLIKETSYQGDIEVYLNGEDAFLKFKDQLKEGKILPPIIFLDLNMPIMTGWEFLDAIHKIPEITSMDLAVYVLSSSIDPRDTQKARDYELVKDFISKPIAMDVLERILNT